MTFCSSSYPTAVVFTLMLLKGLNHKEQEGIPKVLQRKK
jgi:hypothetical protein